MSDTYGTFEVVNIEAEADKPMEIHESYTVPIISCSNQNDNSSSVMAVENSANKNFKPVEIEKNQYRVVEIGKTNSRKPNSLWNYFGLAEKENSVTQQTSNNKDNKNGRKYLSSSSSSDEDRILCLLCYTNDIIHVYMKSTASGNLWRHLNKIHGIAVPKSSKMPRIPIKIRKTKLIQNLLNNTNQLVLDETENKNEDNNTSSSLMYQQNEMITTINNDNNENNICSDEEYITPIPVNGDADENKMNLSSSTDSTNMSLSTITYLNSQDIGSILIQEIAKRPDLYILSHDCTKKELRDQLWKEIYESTGEIMSIQQLQKMWRNIRDRYKKIKNSERQGLRNTGQKYKYYSKLKFLDYDIDVLQNNIKEELCESYSHHKNKSFSISQIDNDQEEHLNKKLKTDFHETIIGDIENSYSQDEEYLENSQQQNINFINNNNNENDENDDNDNDNENVIMFNTNDDYDDIKHKIDTNINVERMISPSMLPSTLKICNCDCNRQDEFDVFGKFIAQKLRKYPKPKSSDIEIKILQLFNSTDN